MVGHESNEFWPTANGLRCLEDIRLIVTYCSFAPLTNLPTATSHLHIRQMEIQLMKTSRALSYSYLNVLMHFRGIIKIRKIRKVKYIFNTWDFFKCTLKTFFSLQLPAHYYYVYNSSLILTLLSLHAMYKAAPGRSAVFVHVFMHCQICIGNINDECKHEGSAHDSFSFTYFF